MIDCTNIRSVKETGKSINTTLCEIKCFIGSNMFMSSLGYPRMRMYWQKKREYLQLVIIYLEIAF